MSSPNGIIIQTVLDNLKTQLEGLTWTPSGNTGPTSLSEVNTYPKFSGAIGSPWCNLLDEPSSAEWFTNKSHQKRTIVQIHVCSDFAEIGEEEAYKRTRYAYEAIEDMLVDDTIMTAAVGDGYTYQGWEDTSIEQSTMIIRTMTISILTKI